MPSASTDKIILRGLGAAPGIGKGTVKVLASPKEMGKVVKGDVLVTDMTTPDFVPAMKRASAIVTNSGGMTCHAAIVSREMGIPCIVGTKNCTSVLHDGQMITVDASRGIVYDGDVGLVPDKKKKPRQLRRSTCCGSRALCAGDWYQGVCESCRGGPGRKNGEASLRRSGAAPRRVHACGHRRAPEKK